jgi:integrase
MHNKGGSITKLKNGKYKWTGYYVDKNGKAHRPNRTFNTLSEAKAYQKIYLSTDRDVLYKANEPFSCMTVNEYHDYWQKKYWPRNDKDVVEGKYSFSTISKWIPTFERYILPTIGKCKLDNINFDKYEKLLKDTDVLDKTIYNINSTLTSMLLKAYRIDQILPFETYTKYEIELDNIRKRLNKPKKKGYKTFNVLSQHDYKIILDFMREHNYYYTNLIEFCRETGIRISECALYETDIKIVKGYFGSTTANDYGSAIINKNITRVRLTEPNKKGNITELRLLNYTKNDTSNRCIPLNHYAISVIEKQRELKKQYGIKSPHLFTTKTGELIDERNVLRSLHNAIEQINKETGANIPIRGMHSLRKLFGNSNIKKSKIEPGTISKAMGHASLQTTMSYYLSYDEDDALSLAKELNHSDPRILTTKIDRVIELFNQGQLLEKLYKSKPNEEIEEELLLIDNEIVELFQELGIRKDLSMDDDIYTFETLREIRELECEIKST